MSADTVEVTEYSEAGDAKVEGLAAGQWRLTMDAFPNRQFWFDLNESAWAAYREAIVTGVAPESDDGTEPTDLWRPEDYDDEPRIPGEKSSLDLFRERCKAADAAKQREKNRA